MRQASWTLSNADGFSLIELIAAIAAIGIMALSIAQFSQVFLRASRLVSDRTQAAFLLQEGIEAVRHLRDDSWANNIAKLVSSTTYFLAFTSSTPAYALTDASPPLHLGKFRRAVVVADVQRDAHDDIVTSGGTTDASMRKFTMELAWRSGGATTTEQVEFYLSNLFEN